MHDASDTIMAESISGGQSGLLDRAAILAACALAGGLFLTVGWFAVHPDDPAGSVSLLTRSGALMMLIQAAALCGVAAALATLIAGRRLADVGTFAAVLGLALVSLRGATAEFLLVQSADVSAAFERGLALKFALEAVAWLVVVVVALAMSAVVMRWCFGVSPDRQTIMEHGIKHTLVATAVGLAGMTLLSTGLSTRSIQHGQVCFVVAAGVWIGTYAACRLVPVRSALWPILSVGLIALLGYVWACVRPAIPALPPAIPSSHFMRVLPVQFISVGTVAALAAFWYVCAPIDNSRSPRDNPSDG